MDHIKPDVIRTVMQM